MRTRRTMARQLDSIDLEAEQQGQALRKQREYCGEHNLGIVKTKHLRQSNKDYGREKFSKLFKK